MGITASLVKQVKGFALDVNLSIGNELAILFGASGAGKSMTLRLIAGLLQPDQGCLKLNERELFNSAAKINVKPQHRSIGYVFQNHSLFPHMSILKNIMFGAKDIAKKEQLDLALGLIRKFRLTGLENKYPSEISGGQQQRATLARAIIKKPAALLLDEPFSALDKPIRIEMRLCLGDVIKDLAIPIILVTHDVYEAFSIADRILVIEKGKIVQTGKPQDIYKNPVNEGVKRLISAEDDRIYSK